MFLSTHTSKFYDLKKNNFIPIAEGMSSLGLRLDLRLVSGLVPKGKAGTDLEKNRHHLVRHPSHLSLSGPQAM